MKRELTKLVPAVLLLFTALAAHAAEPAVGLLLRVQSTFIDETIGGTGSSEALIYRDGLVISKVLPTNQYPWVTYRRAKAKPDALQELQAALSANHVGLIQAPPGCTAVGPIPDVTYDSIVWTWFGKQTRQNRITFSSIGDDPCPQEIDNLVLAIDAFLRKAETQSLLQTQQ